MAIIHGCFNEAFNKRILVLCPELDIIQLNLTKASK